MLIAFSGLPGAGKTSIARELAKILHATYLRIDTIEQAIVSCGNLDPVMEEGYVAAYRIAEDNLRVGGTVIADSVNGIPESRDAWLAVAQSTGARLLDVEIICSDKTEHRRRLDARVVDIAGLAPVTWDAAKAREYHSWSRPRLQIDTAALGVDAGVAVILSALDIPVSHPSSRT